MFGCKKDEMEIGIYPHTYRPVDRDEIVMLGSMRRVLQGAFLASNLDMQWCVLIQKIFLRNKEV